MLDLSTVPLSEKIELLQKLQQYTAATSKLGVEMYRPHAKQDKFHRLGTLKYRYLRTGNRFGKSDCGSAEDVAFALGERRWYPKDDPARFAGIPQRCTKGLILCTDWGKVEEIFTSETQGLTQGKLWKWIPESAFVRRDTNHSGEIYKITVRSIWGGESTIYIDTVAGFKNNDQRSESNWYDWIHVDEPIPEAMWNGYSRGLIDTNGKAWFTCTPLREPWINRFFLPSNRTALNIAEPNFFPNKRGVVDRAVIVGASTDNPHVSPDAIEAFTENLTERERAARLFGNPIELTGCVHPHFSDEHVFLEPPPGWTDINTPPYDHTIRYHIDCHPQTPNAVLFAATAPDGRVYFFDEIFDPSDADAIADQIKTKIKPYFVAGEWIDPSGFIPSMATKTSFADVLVDYGLIVEKASKDLNRGIIQTNVALRKKGYLNFAGNLYRTLYEFDNYVFDDPLKRPDKPKDKDDHMMEGLHRLIMGGLDYISPTIFESSPQPRAHHLLAV